MANSTPDNSHYTNISNGFNLDKYPSIDRYLKVWQSQFLKTISKKHFEKDGFLNQAFFWELMGFLERTYTDDDLKKALYNWIVENNASWEKIDFSNKMTFFRNTFLHTIKAIIEPYLENKQLSTSLQEWFYPMLYMPLDDWYGVYFLTTDGHYDGYIWPNGDYQGSKSHFQGFDLKYALEETQTLIKWWWLYSFNLDAHPELRIVPVEKMKPLKDIEAIRPFIQEMEGYIQANQDVYKKRVSEIIENGMLTL